MIALDAANQPTLASLLDTKMLGCDDAGFADIQAIALSATIRGTIFAVLDACFVMTMALPATGHRRFVPSLNHKYLRLMRPGIRGHQRNSIEGGHQGIDFGGA